MTGPVPLAKLHVRFGGLIPWPCASTDVISGEPMKLFFVREIGEETAAAPGSIIAAGKQGIDLACGDGKVLRVLELQAQGGQTDGRGGLSGRSSNPTLN